MQHHPYNRFLSLLLAALLIGSMLLSCGESKTNTDAASSDLQAADGEGVSAEEMIAADEEETVLKDMVPDTLSYDGATIRIFVSNGSGQNEEMYAGQGELTGDVENDAVIQRNMTAEERLDITLEYIGDPTGSWDTIASILSKFIMAGDTTYDMYLGNEYGHVNLIALGGLKNVNELEYIDWDKPWWNVKYMDEMMIGNDARYFLAGDYIIETVRMAHTLFFNKNFYQDAFGNPEELYDLVLDGTWTIDKLSSVAEAAYVDLNNNGQSDVEDRLGYVTYLAAASVDPFAYLGDVPYSTHDADGNIVLNLMSDQAVTLGEKVVSFFHQPGSVFQMGSNVSGTVFKEGRSLFLGLQSLGTAKWYRDMEDDYGFLPYPKLDETQRAYHSLVADNALIGSIPSASLNLDKIGAVLEVLASETWRTVMPAWYETSLKIKYSRDNIAAQIIDLIHDSTTTNFIYAYSNPLSGTGQIMREMVANNSTDYASAVARKEKVAKKSLERLVAAYEKNFAP
ncbi:MAG: hypothetical protein II889_04585 [Clostridia bacterium]|nr:hypothetical protein [Clostridia bacterium]